MRNKLLYLLILSLLFVPFSLAVDSHFKINSDSSLNIPCYNDGAPCITASCNITIFTPTQLLTSNSVMTQDGFIYSYNFTPTELGVYSASMVCEEDGVYGSKSILFEVNNMGNKRENSAILIGFLIFFGLLSILITIIFFLKRIYLWASIMLPVNAGIIGFLFFNLYLFSLVLSNLFFVLYIISMIIFVVLILFVSYEIIYQVLGYVNKRRRSVFQDSV